MKFVQKKKREAKTNWICLSNSVCLHQTIELNSTELNWIEWIRLFYLQTDASVHLVICVLKFVYRHFRRALSPLFTVNSSSSLSSSLSSNGSSANNRFYWRMKQLKTGYTFLLPLPPCLRDFHFCKQKFSVYFSLVTELDICDGINSRFYERYRGMHLHLVVDATKLEIYWHSFQRHI